MVEQMQPDGQAHVELDPDHEDLIVRSCNRLLRHAVYLSRR